MTDGPDIEYDEIIARHQGWANAERSDGSRSGERRQQIGEFVENQGLENKAFSQFRAGLKIKEDGKRQDWLRSVKALIPIAESYIFGNGTQDMLDRTSITVGGRVPDDANFDVDKIDSGDDEFDKQLAASSIADK